MNMFQGSTFCLDCFTNHFVSKSYCDEQERERKRKLRQCRKYQKEIADLRLYHEEAIANERRKHEEEIEQAHEIVRIDYNRLRTSGTGRKPEKNPARAKIPPDQSCFTS